MVELEASITRGIWGRGDVAAPKGEDQTYGQKCHYNLRRYRSHPHPYHVGTFAHYAE